LKKVPQLPSVPSLRTILEGLKNKRMQADWKQHFPNAKTYDKSNTHLSSASILPDLKDKYGINSDDLDIGSLDRALPEALAALLLESIPASGLDRDFNKYVISTESIRNKLMFF